MGNVTGTYSYQAYVKEPENHPDIKNGPSFDPMIGFPNGRKERVMKVSDAEMEAAGIAHEHRDYCAHLLIDFYKCRKDKWPMAALCNHERHTWDQCQADDFHMRMREFERERRLKARENRKTAMKLEEQTIE
eukprot:GHVO01045867.1.p1 GENE.GHVO01045867.1~~GHVO01045867.1.p1  ORF type:complete len:152 (+),score=23.75 GHVO01045867.1:61-456(+)